MVRLNEWRPAAPYRHGKVDIVRNHDPAFTAGDHAWLGEVEYRGIAEASDHSGLVPRTDRLGRILDEVKAMRARQRAQFRPGCGMAVGIGANDRLGCRGQFFGYLAGGDGARPIVDVGEDRCRSAQRDGMARLAMAIGRQDDLVAKANAKALQGQQQAHGSAGDRDCMAPAGIGDEGSLQLRDLDASAQRRSA